MTSGMALEDQSAKVCFTNTTEIGGPKWESGCKQFDHMTVSVRRELNIIVQPICSKSTGLGPQDSDSTERLQFRGTFLTEKEKCMTSCGNEG